MDFWDGGSISKPLEGEFVFCEEIPSVPKVEVRTSYLAKGHSSKKESGKINQ